MMRKRWRTIIKHPLCLIGASDGGAHTKFLTIGRYPTHFLAHWVRDKQVMSLEEAHWRLSTMLGWAIGIRDRGWLREGMPADIVIYDLEKLACSRWSGSTICPTATGGECRRRTAITTRWSMARSPSKTTCTGALPGKVLRSYDIAG